MSFVSPSPCSPPQAPAPSLLISRALEPGCSTPSTHTDTEHTAHTDTGQREQRERRRMPAPAYTQSHLLSATTIVNPQHLHRGLFDNEDEHANPQIPTVHCLTLKHNNNNSSNHVTITSSSDEMSSSAHFFYPFENNSTTGVMNDSGPAASITTSPATTTTAASEDLSILSPTPRALTFPRNSNLAPNSTTSSSAFDLDGPTPRAFAFPQGVLEHQHNQFQPQLYQHHQQQQQYAVQQGLQHLSLQVPATHVQQHIDQHQQHQQNVINNTNNNNNNNGTVTSPTTSSSSSSVSSSPFLSPNTDNNFIDNSTAFLLPPRTVTPLPSIRRSQSSHPHPHHHPYSNGQFGIVGTRTSSPVAQLPSFNVPDPDAGGPVTLLHRRRGASVSSLTLPSSAGGNFFGTGHNKVVKNEEERAEDVSGGHNNDDGTATAAGAGAISVTNMNVNLNVGMNVQAPNPHAHAITLNGGPERRPKRGDEDYIKRPENAFILFRRSCCLKQNGPGGANDGSTIMNGVDGNGVVEGGAAGGRRQRQADLSKTISQLWRSLSSEERKFWDDLAKQKKKEHEEMYPWYVYQPSRSTKDKKDKKGEKGEKCEKERSERKSSSSKVRERSRGGGDDESDESASRSVSVCTRDSRREKSGSRVRGAGGVAEREREREKRKHRHHHQRHRASSVTSSVTTATSHSNSSLTTASSSGHPYSSSGYHGFGGYGGNMAGYYPYDIGMRRGPSSNSTCSSSLGSSAESSEDPADMYACPPLGAMAPPPPPPPTDMDMDMEVEVDGTTTTTTNLNVNVLGASPLASFSLESGPLHPQVNTYGQSHGHGHSLSMSAVSNGRSQGQAGGAGLGLSPLNFVLAQSRRSSSASGAPADGPIGDMYAVSGSGSNATASSSSGSDVSARTAPGPSPLQSIKIPTLFGGGSNVPIQESPKEDQQQSGRGTGYESGQVPEYSTVDRNSTSGQMNTNAFQAQQQHEQVLVKPQQQHQQQQRTRALTTTSALPGMGSSGMTINIPSSPSTGGPLSAPVPSSTSSPSSFSLSPSSSSSTYSDHHQLYLPGVKPSSSSSSSVSSSVSSSTTGVDWEDDYGLPAWASMSSFDEQQSSQLFLHGQQQQSPGGYGSIDMDFSWMSLGMSMSGGSTGGVGVSNNSTSNNTGSGCGTAGMMMMDELTGSVVDTAGVVDPYALHFYNSELLDPSQL